MKNTFSKLILNSLNPLIINYIFNIVDLISKVNNIILDNVDVFNKN